jgi:hypothetical protein
MELLRSGKGKAKGRKNWKGFEAVGLLFIDADLQIANKV